MSGLRIKYLKPALVAEHLARADALCAATGARLTPLRRRVLELVVRSGRPVGAYELLDQMRACGHKGAPPTVYRALDFLQQQGLVHRIAMANAYVACSHPGCDHHALIFVCTECGNALELEETQVKASVAARAEAVGFRVPGQPIEVAGTCPLCQEGRP
ncbi:MAG TPA: transcriptional repressor [Thioalkalivibrio sp.]|nr:transcriptional repressor [Thioalkalivibrio sp.]